MNFKYRIKRIEAEFSIGCNKIRYLDLLKPEYTYTGKCFDSIDEMIDELHITQLPPWPEHTDIETLISKKLISVESLSLGCRRWLI